MFPVLRAWILVGIPLGAVACSSATLVDDLINALEAAVDCSSCQALLIPLQTLAFLGDSTFSQALDALCKTLKVEDDDVCQGFINQQGPIIAHDLRSIDVEGQTGTKLCDVLLGLCQPPPVNPHTVTFPKTCPSKSCGFQIARKSSLPSSSLQRCTY